MKEHYLSRLRTLNERLDLNEKEVGKNSQKFWNCEVNIGNAIHAYFYTPYDYLSKPDEVTIIWSEIADLIEPKTREISEEEATKFIHFFQEEYTRVKKMM